MISCYLTLLNGEIYLFHRKNHRQKMGIEEYAANFISSLLFSYSEELDKDKVELSLTKSMMKLKEIEIYKNAFLQHGIPLEVRRGLISNIAMKLSEFVNIEVNDVFFSMKIIDSNFPTIDEFKDMRDHQLHAHELFKAKISKIMSKFLISNFNAQIQKMIAKSVINVSKIYICIENSDSNFTIGLSIDNINIFGNHFDNTSNENSKNDNKNNFIDFKKNIIITGLKMFMKMNLEDDIKIDLSQNNFSFSMNQFFSNHSHQKDNQIVEIDEINGFLMYDENNLHVIIENEEMMESKFNFQAWQLTKILELFPRLKIFHNYFITRHIKRPNYMNFIMSSNPQNSKRNVHSLESDMWLYVHRCAIEVKKEKNILGNFIHNFQMRNKYVRNWQSFNRKPFNPKELYVLDHTLSYYEITLFRFLTEIMRSKWSRKPLSKDDVFLALDFVELDLPNIINYFINKLKVKTKFSKIIANFFFKNKQNFCNIDQSNFVNHCLSFSIIKPDIEINFDKLNNFICKFDFSSFKLKLNQNDVIFESIENGLRCFNTKIIFYNQMLTKNVLMKLDVKVINEVFMLSLEDFFKFIHCFSFDKFSLTNLIGNFKNSSILSLIDYFDININLFNCQLSSFLTSDFRLTFIWDKLSIYRQEQLYLQDDNITNSQIDDSKKENHDIIFDLVNSNLMFSNNNDFHKLLLPGLSIHSIMIPSISKIIVYISPFYMTVSWDDIFDFKTIISNILEFIQPKLSKEFSLSLFTDIIPDFLKHFEIDGGIPTITLSLDLPTAKNTLKTIKIDTVKFKGNLINLTASVEKVTFEKYLEVTKINILLNEMRFIFDHVRFSMLKTLSILPRDLMKLISLNPLSLKFSFLMKVLCVDLAVDWIPEVVDFTVFNFSGKSLPFKDGSLDLKAFVKCINICGKPLIENQSVVSQIHLNKIVNIVVDFGNLNFLFQHDLLSFVFNSDFRVEEIFPTDFALDWKIKIPCIKLNQLVYAENVVVQLLMSDVMFGGDIYLETLNVMYMKCDTKYPLSLSIDLAKHFISASLNFDYMELDIIHFMSLTQMLLHYPFHIYTNVIFDVKMSPTTIALKAGKDILSMNMRSSVYFEGEKPSVTFQMFDFEIFFNDSQLLSIPYLETFGIGSWHCQSPSIILDFSSKILFKLFRFMNKIPIPNIKLWNINHNLVSIPISFKFDVSAILDKSLELNTLVFGQLVENELKANFSSSCSVFSSWFNKYDIMNINDAKLTINFANHNIDVNIDKAISMKIDVFSFDLKSNEQFLQIKNNTSLIFDSDFGKIPKNSLFQFHEFIHQDEIELSCKYGQIPLRRENFLNNGKMKVIFQNNGENRELVLSLNSKKNLLKIKSVFEIKNETTIDLKIECQSENYEIKAKSTLYTNKALANIFTINGIEINHKSTQHTKNKKEKIELQIENTSLIVVRKKRSLIIRSSYFIRNEFPYGLIINGIIYPKYGICDFSFLSNIFEIESSHFPKQNISFDHHKTKYESFKLYANHDIIPYVVVRVQMINDFTFVFSPSIIISTKVHHACLSFDHQNFFTIKKDSDFSYSPKKKLINRIYITIPQNGYTCEEVILNDTQFENELIIIRPSQPTPKFNFGFHKVKLQNFMVFPLIISNDVKKFDYYNVNHITLNYFIHLKNKLSEPLVFYNQNTHISFFINSNDIKPLLEWDSSFNFSLTTKSHFSNIKENSAEVSKDILTFNFLNINSQKVHLHGFFLPVEIKVSIQKSVKTITFTHSKIFPYRLINCTDSSLYIKNIEIISNSTFLFTPNSNNRFLNINFSDSLKTINIGQIGVQNLDNHIFCCEEHYFQQNEIVFSNDCDNLPKRIHLQNDLIHFNLNLSIHSLNLTLCEKQTQELIFLLKGITVTINLQKNIHLLLESLLITDKIKRKIFSSLENDFFILNLSFLTPFHLQSILLSMKPFYFNFDLSLFSYYFSFLSPILKRSNHELIKHELFMNFLIEVLKIDPISVCFAFECNQPLSKEFPQLLRILPSIKSFNIDLNENSINNFSLSQDIINYDGTFNISTFFIAKTFLKTLFSLNMIGSPFSLINNLFIHDNLQIKNIFAFIFGFLENIADYLRSITHYLGGNEMTQKDVYSPIVWGTTSLVLNVFHGMTLFFTNIRDKSLAKAIIQFLFNIISGGLDCISGFLCWLRTIFYVDSMIEEEIEESLPEKNEMITFEYI
ncbi:hypothetical protein TRFO_19190 [Tritrichomonas foetus]|uniref:Uncharacterized protein n=1 Tax=Tritrichomonas foetus TaxID=1144522 RepID=A0A1J4KJ65_9EUKA|nr:hypothetical protein TRFO_19190 [Tritrichomonas foetus]|eukprot:OHT11383.1 hypothetical protein TRFO_19190 [Tritrichomonas foetus]